MKNQGENAAIENEKLVDIRSIHVNKDLPREQRIADFVRQIRNPYLFKCGQYTVHVGFTANGATIEDCIAGLLR